MTLPKDTVAHLFADSVRPFLEPGERVVSAAFVVPGPSPRRVGFLGAALQAARGEGDLWMSVTDRRVVFLRSSFLTQKPRGLAWADARHAVDVAEVHDSERSGWNWFVYLRPDGEALRVNVSVLWEEELDAILEALGSRPEPPPVEGWG